MSVVRIYQFENHWS